MEILSLDLKFIIGIAAFFYQYRTSILMLKQYLLNLYCFTTRIISANRKNSYLTVYINLNTDRKIKRRIANGNTGILTLNGVYKMVFAKGWKGKSYVN